MRCWLFGLCPLCWPVGLPAVVAAPVEVVCRLDATRPAEAAAFMPCQAYRYPAGAVAAEVPSRDVLFADRLVASFEGLAAGSDHALSMTFLSDGPRTLSLAADGEILESSLVLPAGKVLEKRWALPAKVATDGRLLLELDTLAGPNAVVQSLELLSSRPGALKPGPRPAAPDTSPAALDKLVLPLPRITPRPSEVAGVAVPVMSLNGNWRFAAGDGAEFQPIEVPGEWAMQGFTVPAGQAGRYAREFTLPDDWQGKVVRLRFDAVHALCTVKLNGREVGGHAGGFVPFELDLTPAVRPGDNLLEVEVRSESVADSVACISQYAAHPVGGIVRKVSLLCLPPTHLARQWHETKVDGTTARLTIHSETHGPEGAAGADDQVRHRLLARDGREVAAATASGGSCTLVIPDARLWTSETPDLLTLETTVGGETVRQRVGLREVQVRGNRVFVNGMPVRFHGICRHEVHPLRGRSLTPELCRRDAELFRAANVNLVRTSHYPPSEEFLAACDELGIFVECEAAVCWIEHGASPVWKSWDHLDPKYFPYLLRANLDNVAAHRDHPSVVIWSLGNESLWSPLFGKVNELVKRHDPSRPTTFHDQCWGDYNNARSTADIANYHYPSETNPGQWSAAPRPVWFGEYAHVQCYNRRELVTDPGIRADWGRPLARMVDLMWQQPGCLGGAIWSGVDDVFHLPDGKLKGYGHWGPIDGWRRRKPEWHGMHAAYSPFKVLKATPPDLAAGHPVIRLEVQNRFNFTDLSDITIAWRCASRNGTLRMELPPHAVGTLEIDAAPIVEDAEAIVLTVTDRRGVAVADLDLAELLDDRVPHGLPNKPGERDLARVRSREVEVEGDRLLLREAGRSANLPLPIPLVLPLNAEGGAAGPAGTQLANVIEPFTPLANDWRPQLKREGKAMVARGGTAALDGWIRIEPGDDPFRGAFTVSYEFKVLGDVNPRQWGLVLTVPGQWSQLEWDRRGVDWPFRVPSQGSIARWHGVAQANPVARETVEEARGEPSGPWEQDANPLGSNDFRSTKRDIFQCRLSAPGWQRGDPCLEVIRMERDPPMSARAWIDGDRIRLLVAGFNTGGSDHFFATHYAAERRPLKKGDVIRGSFALSPGLP